MNIKQLIYIALGWLLLNALLPIVFRSFERLYQKQIDFLVRKSLSYLKRLSFKICQLILISVFLPNIILKTILEKAYPKVFDITSMEYFRLGTNAILDKEFPENFIRAYRMSKERKSERQCGRNLQ